MKKLNRLINLKNLIIIIALPFLLLSWSQGCGVVFFSQTRFTQQNNSATTGQSTEDPGHGGTYDGKLRVLHHYLPGFQCENRNAPESILINQNIDQDQWLLIQNSKEKCAVIDQQPVQGVQYDDVKKEASYDGKSYVAPFPYMVDASEDPNLPDVKPLDAVCEDANGKCSLRASLQTAQIASTTNAVQVQIPAATYYLTQELTLTSAANGHVISVRGSGSAQTILNGQGKTNILRVSGAATSGAVKLRGFTLQQGLLPDIPSGSGPSASALENSLPTTLNLLDIVFLKNNGADTFKTTSAGGPVVIESSRFLDNQPGSWVVNYDNIKSGQLTFDQVEISNSTIKRTGCAVNATFTAKNTVGVIVRNSLIRLTHGGCALYFQNVDGALIENSTIADNDQQALTNRSGDTSVTGPITFVNSTVYNNGALTPWGASNFYVLSSGSKQVLEFKNSIVAQDSPSVSNCILNNGATATATNSLINDTTCNQTGTGNILVNPSLAPFANNGGFTPTRLPLNGSPVIDAADNASCPAQDQRGQPRPVDHLGGGARCDIGAVELQ